MELDPIDRRILRELQLDAGQNLETLGDKVGLSRNACWRRVKLMEEAQVITGRGIRVDPGRVGLPLTVFLQISINRHDADWLKDFKSAVRQMPEILSVHRMTGDLDYLIRARVADVPGYDRLYQRLTEKIALHDVSASFVMEDIKDEPGLPL